MRVWQPVVFGGFGYARSHISGDDRYLNGNQEWAFSYGLLNKFRISKAVDLNLELKNMLVRDYCFTALSIYGFTALVIYC